MRPRVPQESPRRASRKENFATFRAVSKGASALNMSGVTQLLKKKAGLDKSTTGPQTTSTSLVARRGKYSAREGQPLGEIKLSENNNSVVVSPRPRTNSLEYSRLSWVEKENHNLTRDYACEIHAYMKKIETVNKNALSAHKITTQHRARMVDWMIEVLTNFKCDEQTFFSAVNILDRYLKEKRPARELSELHIIGVTCMFLASKNEDIYPLRMSMVYEKIGHKKLPIETIKNYERDILATLDYMLNIPTSYDFLTTYLKKLYPKPDTPDRQLIEKMAVYLAKMTLHDYELCTSKKPSLLAVSELYVSLKICEQLRKTKLIDSDFVKRLTIEADVAEADLISCAQRVLHNAQNFETLFAGLENLKKIHFSNLSSYLKN